MKKFVPSLFHSARLALLIALFATSWASAQVRSFKHFGLDRNTFPSRIECMAQAPGGELLLGTLTGLVIYDGYSFETLTDQDGLLESAISSVTVVDGEIWLGHWAGSVTRLNAELQVDEGLNVQSALNYHSVTALLPLEDSRVLIGTEGSGLYLQAEGTLEKVLLPGTSSTLNIRQIMMLDDAVYVVTSEAIHRCSDLQSLNRWEILFQPKNFKIRVAKKFGGRWYIGADEGAFKLDASSQQAIPLGDSTADNVFMNVTAMAQDADGVVWFASERHGVMLVPVEEPIDFIKRENGLSYNRVTDLLCDHEGTMWVATAAGLDQHLGSAFTLFDYRTGLRDNLVWDFVPISNNQLIVASSVGLQELELNNSWSDIRSERSLDVPFKGARKVMVDSRKALWVIANDGSLWSRTEEGVFQAINLNELPAMTMAEFGGHLWVGTSAGLIELRGSQVYKRYTPEDGLGGMEINGLFAAPNGQELWITSLGGGITRLREGRFKTYDEEAGMNSRVIHDVAFDRSGSAWLATYDRGLLRFQDETFNHVSDSININCFAIAIDERDRVWVGHNWGLDCYDPENRSITKYSGDEGFLGIEVNPGAITFDPSGHLWMGTIMGLLRFSPDKARTDIPPPHFRLEQVMLGGRTFAESEKVSVAYGNTDLLVEHQTISLANPLLNRLRYRLLGLHDHWKTAKGNEPIEYAALPSGSFTMEIQPCNAQNQCLTTPISFPIEVVPPIYSRWWFYCIVFFVLVFALFYLDRYRNTELQDQKIVLEDRLASRTQELEDIRIERKGLQLSQDRAELFAVSLTASPDADTQRAEKYLQQFSVASSTKSGLGSDHFVFFELGTYKVIGLVDFGVPELIGSMSFLTWKRLIDKELIEKRIVSREGFVRTWNASLEQVSRTLSDTGKVKNITSGFLVFSEDEASIFLDGIGIAAVMDGHEKVTIHHGDAQGRFENLSKSGEQFYNLPKGARVFMLSDGVLNQLNEDGTRKYGHNRLSKLIERHYADQKPVHAEDVLQDVTSWRGILEQFEDGCIISFRYA